MKTMQDTSDAVFTAITSGGFRDYKEAEQAVAVLYIPDMSFDRGGICHALKRLEKHYDDSKRLRENS